MSSVVISGDTSGTITVSAPAVAGTTTLTLPATTGTVLNDATVGVCRAWVNFNGTGTVAIRASFNVSSITDSGTGDYRVNFTTAMSDANFVCEVSAYDASSGATAIKVQPYRTVSTSSQPVVCSNAAGTALTDLDQVHVTIFR